MSKNTEKVSFLNLFFIMRAPVHQVPLYSPNVILPDLFNMDQRPLPPAESKVLQCRNHEGFFLHQFILTQVTPSGKLA